MLCQACPESARHAAQCQTQKLPGCARLARQAPETRLGVQASVRLSRGSGCARRQHRSSSKQQCWHGTRPSLHRPRHGCLTVASTERSTGPTTTKKRTTGPPKLPPITDVRIAGFSHTSSESIAALHLYMYRSQQGLLVIDEEG